MRLNIINKFLSPTGSSKVLDDEGKKVYKVKGVFLSPRKTKKICDLEGHKLFVVKNQFFSWLRHVAYIFNADGEKIGTIKKKKLSVTSRFETEDFEDDIKITGKFLHVNLDVTKDDKHVATIIRRFSFIVDKFELQTDDVENLPFYVAIVIALDNIADKREKD